MTLPADATNVHLDAGGDDAAQARAELNDLLLKVNQTLAHLRAIEIVDKALAIGDGLENNGPDVDLRIKLAVLSGLLRDTSGLTLDFSNLTEATSAADGDFLAGLIGGNMRKIQRTNLLPVAAPRGYIDGFITSNNGSDAAHDVDIGPGFGRDDADTEPMARAAALTGKQFDAPWAVGAGAGALLDPQIDGAQTVTFNDNGASPDDVTIDAGTWVVTPKANDTLIVVGGTNAGTYPVTAATSTVINVATGTFTTDGGSASAIYILPSDETLHGFMIKRTDTGVVDFGVSTSLSPTLPTNYTKSRFIWSWLTDSSANIIPYTQYGDRCLWVTIINDYSQNNPGANAVLVSFSVATGLKLPAIVAFAYEDVDISTQDIRYMVVTDPDQTDSSPGPGAFSASHAELEAARDVTDVVYGEFLTNTSGQLRYHIEASDGGVTVRAVCYGFIHPRGKDS